MFPYLREVDAHAWRARHRLGMFAIAIIAPAVLATVISQATFVFPGGHSSIVGWVPMALLSPLLAAPLVSQRYTELELSTIGMTFFMSTVPAYCAASFIGAGWVLNSGQVYMAAYCWWGVIGLLACFAGDIVLGPLSWLPVFMVTVTVLGLMSAGTLEPYPVILREPLLTPLIASGGLALWLAGRRLLHLLGRSSAVTISSGGVL